MEKIETLHSIETLKELADPKRQTILRYLMAEPATLTQLGERMGQSPAWVRHHVKSLEEAGWIQVHEVRVVSGVTEKFYKAIASAFLLQQLILPKTEKPYIIFSGSHDTGIEHIAQILAPYLTLFTLPVGSLDGLVNLRQGLCHVSGSHLMDADGRFNTSYVRHIFPDRYVEIVAMANRTQGLIVQKGNPKNITTLFDLLRSDVTFINRNPGSGTRLWIDKEFTDLGLPASEVKGYAYYVTTHSDATRMIQTGKADATIGIQAAAHEADLTFLPLFEERYDLVFEHGHMRLLSPLIDYLQTARFRKELESLSGYDTSVSGVKIPLE